MTARRTAHAPIGWDAEVRRRLLAGIETGVWTLSGAAYRFGLHPDLITSSQRGEGEREPRAHDRSRFADYVELL